jgi:hypothetical protein
MVDDVDGSEATQTITFGAFGKTYEIDLNDSNASNVLNCLTRWATAGREVVRESPKSPTRTRGAQTTDKPSGSTSEMREWARQNGWPELGDRGRVAAHIVKAFNERPQGPVAVVGEDNVQDVVEEIKAETNTDSVTARLPKVNPLPKVPRKALNAAPKVVANPFNPADSALLHS